MQLGNNALWIDDFEEVYDIDISEIFPPEVKTYNPDMIDQAIYHIKMLHQHNQGHIIFIKDDMKTSHFSKFTTLTTEKITTLLEQGFTHITQSTFVGTRRQTDLSFSNSAIIIDLDFYKIDKYKHLKPLEMLKHIDFKGAEPTYVFTSGNGLNLVYCFEKNIALYNQPKNLRLRTTIFNALADRFAEFGADRQTSDITRFNKIPSVLNYKNNSQVEILEQFEVEYSLSDLVEKLGIKKTENVKVVRPKREQKIFTMLSPYSLAITRYEDIQRLIELRNYDFKNREQALFLIANFHLQAYKNIERTSDYIEKTNLKLLRPLPDREIRTLLRNLNSKYNYKNSTLIDLLEITKGEMEHMKTLIDSTEKQERQNKNRRKPPEENTRLMAKAENMAKVIAFKSTGMKTKDIAEKLGVSIRYVNKIWNELKGGSN